MTPPSFVDHSLVRGPEPPAWADPDVERCLDRLSAGRPYAPDSRRPGMDPSAVAEVDEDAQAWLFRERARYVETGICDPWAEHLLRRAGLMPTD